MISEAIPASAQMGPYISALTIYAVVVMLLLAYNLKSRQFINRISNPSTPDSSLGIVLLYEHKSQSQSQSTCPIMDCKKDDTECVKPHGLHLHQS